MGNTIEGLKLIGRALFSKVDSGNGSPLVHAESAMDMMAYFDAEQKLARRSSINIAGAVAHKIMLRKIDKEEQRLQEREHLRSTNEVMQTRIDRYGGQKFKDTGWHP